MTHVVCVGDLMVDVVATLPGPLAFGSDTPAPISFHGGGAAANVAAWLVACGATATFVGRIGDDPMGRWLMDDLIAAGVAANIALDPARPTGTCIVLVAPDGERTMVPSAGANAGASDVDLLPADADWLYLSGYALLDPGARPFALAALSLARERRWSVAVDAASAAPLHAAGAPTFFDWIGRGLVLLANEDESTALTGIADPESAARALARACGQAVVKCGRGGAVWSDGSATRQQSADDVHVVDTTGAGDAFAAGFLATDGDIGQMLAGARAVGHPGARPTTTT
jgi:ribokinase